MRLGFDEEKSTSSIFQENYQNPLTDKHTKTKLSLATLSTSKYDRNDGMESAENSFSFTDPSLEKQKRLQQLSKPMERNCWKVISQPILLDYQESLCNLIQILVIARAYIFENHCFILKI